MKRLGVLAAATLLSVGAMAADHTISGTGRMGLFMRDYDAPTTRNSSAIEADYFRINFDGVLNASTKYHFVLDPVQVTSTTTNDTTTNVSAFINEFWINRSIGESLNVIIGKQKVLQGSMEYWTSTPDIYSKSGFYSAATTTGSDRTGAATLAYKFMGHDFKAQLFNGNEDKRSTGTKSQSKFGYAFLFKGNLMDGMIKPIFGYTVDPTARAGGPDTYLAGGAQVNAAGFTFEADYGLKTQKNAATATTNLTTSSIVGLVRHNGENFQPFVKFIADTNKTDSVKSFERTAFDLGLEMKEVKDDSVRYHVVYSSQSSKTAGVKDAAKPNQIYAGVKFTADILK